MTGETNDVEDISIDFKPSIVWEVYTENDKPDLTKLYKNNLSRDLCKDIFCPVEIDD